MEEAQLAAMNVTELGLCMHQMAGQEVWQESIVLAKHHRAPRRNTVHLYLQPVETARLFMREYHHAVELFRQI